MLLYFIAGAVTICEERHSNDRRPHLGRAEVSSCRPFVLMCHDLDGLDCDGSRSKTSQLPNFAGKEPEPRGVTQAEHSEHGGAQERTDDMLSGDCWARRVDRERG